MKKIILTLITLTLIQSCSGTKLSREEHQELRETHQMIMELRQGPNSQP
jgi:hypothetical protein